MKVADVNDITLAGQLRPSTQWFETGTAAEDERRLQAAAHAQISAHAARRSANAQLLASVKCKCFSGILDRTADSRLKRCAEEDACNIAVSCDRGTRQADFQSSGFGRITDKGIADVQSEAISRAADRNAETAPTRSAMIDNQCAESRVGDDERSDNFTPDCFCR